ncbi:MAG: TonB-dependent copper receptor [Endomicrobium sp.]|jgi:iron complex outermembrane receptor protein|nr:TonB-dependent copper receptor [Endomicrobium sp.]
MSINKYKKTIFFLVAVVIFVRGSLFGVQEISVEQITVTAAPLESALEIGLDPKKPKQPVPAADAADYLKSVPGFSAIRSGGANGDSVFRGMFGSRINILTDGGNVLGGCPSRMDSPSSYISPESYDSVSVIKGPQTVLYGGGASAATVRFERKPEKFEQGDKPFRIKASALAGSFERIGSSLDAAAGNEKLYFRVTGNYDKSSDYKDGGGNIVPSKWEKWNTDVFFGWTPDKDTLLEIGAGTGDGYARYAGRGMDGSQFKRESFSAKFSKKNIGKNIDGGTLDEFEFQSYYNYSDHIMDNYTLRTPSGMMPMPMLSNPSRAVYGARAAFTFNIEQSVFINGIDVQFDEHKGRTDKNKPFIKDIDYNKYGIFSQLQMDLDELNKIVSGVRFDFAQAGDFRSASKTDGDTKNAFLPSVFARFEETVGNTPFSWYAGIGHSQRFPDYWELSQTRMKDGSKNTFEDLNPEKTTQLDVGAHYKTEKINIWLSAYAGIIKDYILFNYITMAMSENKYVQNVDAGICGYEIGAEYVFTQYLKFDSALAYSFGENTTDNRPLPQIPPLEARFGLNYETQKWQTGLLWRAAAKQNRIAAGQGNVVGKDFAESEAFNVLSLNVSIELTSYTRLSLGIDNIFDVKYYEHLNMAGNAGFGFSANEQINEPGRMFWGKINVSF